MQSMLATVIAVMESDTIFYRWSKTRPDICNMTYFATLKFMTADWTLGCLSLI